MFVLNECGYYFQIDTDKVPVNKELLTSCDLFDDEEQLLQAVARKTGIDVEEARGTTFYITVRDGREVLIDDRGMCSLIEEPVESYITTFEL